MRADCDSNHWINWCMHAWPGPTIDTGFMGLVCEMVVCELIRVNFGLPGTQHGGPGVFTPNTLLSHVHNRAACNNQFIIIE